MKKSKTYKVERNEIQMTRKSIKEYEQEMWAPIIEYWWRDHLKEEKLKYKPIPKSLMEQYCKDHSKLVEYIDGDGFYDSHYFSNIFDLRCLLFGVPDDWF